MADDNAGTGGWRRAIAIVAGLGVVGGIAGLTAMWLGIYANQATQPGRWDPMSGTD